MKKDDSSEYGRVQSRTFDLIKSFQCSAPPPQCFFDLIIDKQTVFFVLKKPRQETCIQDFEIFILISSSAKNNKRPYLSSKKGLLKSFC